MYTGQEAAVLKGAEAGARIVIDADRRRYAPFYAALEGALHSGLIVGGAAGVRMLLMDGASGGQDADPPVYELYSVALDRDARRLADALYNGGLGFYASANPIVAGQEVAITVDGRELARVYALAEQKGAKIADAVMPLPVAGLYGGARLSAFGPELQLLQVYAGLCSPARAADWPRLLATERALRRILLAGIRPRLEKTVAGGAAPDPAWQRRKATLRAALVQALAPGARRIRVAFPAADRETAPLGATQPALTGGHEAGLWYVSAVPLAEEYDIMAAVAARLGFAVGKAPNADPPPGSSAAVRASVNSPRVPTEPRLQRLTLHVQNAERREAVLHIYNIGQYELVPHAAGSGTPFVTLRCLLVEVWTLLWMLKKMVITAAFARTRLHELIQSFEAVAADYDARVAAGQTAELLPRDAYIGSFEDAAIAAKRLAAERRKASGAGFVPAYFPAARNAKKATRG